MTDVQTSATIASLRAEVERLRVELQGEREDLATARERAGVLERECRKWRAWCDAEDTVGISEPLLWQDVVNSRRETDHTNALDAAKFGGA